MSETNIGANPETRDIRQILREVTREAKKSKTPIFIAVLAALLALVSMADGDAGQEAMVAHIEASNKFSYFQAKNIRKTDSEIAAEIFQSLDKPELAAKWKAKADRYDAEKVDILKSARAQQAVRGTAVERGRYYSVAIALLQISIVLASASLILGGGILLGSSMVLTLVAVFFACNGYGLYWDIPTNPDDIIKSVDAMRAQIVNP